MKARPIELSHDECLALLDTVRGGCESMCEDDSRQTNEAAWRVHVAMIKAGVHVRANDELGDDE